MDYDLFLLVLVCLTCVGLLSVVVARVRPVPVGWVVVYIAIALLAFIGWLRGHPSVVYCATAVWFVLVFLPGLIGKIYYRRLMQQRYAAAYRLAKILSWLHPADGWRELPQVIRAFVLAQQGDVQAAANRLQQFQEANSTVALQAVANLYRITQRWEELIAWQKGHWQRIQRQGQFLPLMLRVHGEVGDINSMVELYASRRQQIAKLLPATARDLCRLALFAFCGRRQAVEGLFAGRLSVLPDSTRAFWLATADMAAGEVESARQQLEGLLPEADPLLRGAIERRLAHLQIPRQPLAAEVDWILDAAERDLGHEEKYAATRSLFSRRALATQLLIAGNLAMFAAEVCLGGSTDPDVLYRLGALDSTIFNGEWWRLLTPLFLHWGPLHLVMNMIGLWLLGPMVEYALGFWRFLAVYLLAGIGSSAIVLLASNINGQAVFMVGASGSIMGLIGATAAMLLRGWTREKAPAAKRRLTAVLLFVLVQTISDAIIPQVSMTAHLSGAAIGFVVAAALLRGIPTEK